MVNLTHMNETIIKNTEETSITNTVTMSVNALNKNIMEYVTACPF